MTMTRKRIPQRTPLARQSFWVKVSIFFPPGHPIGLFSSGFCAQKCIHISYIAHECYISCPLYTPRLYDPKNIYQRTAITMLLIRRSSTISCYIPSGSIICIITLFLNTFDPHASLSVRDQVLPNVVLFSVSFASLVTFVHLVVCDLQMLHNIE
jgi:hypothetical protein